MALGVAAVGCGGQKSNSASNSAATSGAKSGQSGAVANAAAPVAAQAPSQLGVTDAATRQQVRTGDMTLGASSADDVARVADQAVAVAGDVGGQTDGDRRSGGSSPTADLVLRVPPAALDATVDRLAGLAKVTSRSVQTEDVTSQYTDLEGRIGALRTSTARLVGFLGAATDANQIASLEGELTRRETDLESLQGQLRVLSAKTDLATLKVSVRTEQSVATSSAPAPAKALTRGWDTFRLVMAWALAIVLATLPFLVLVALLLVARRWWTRRRSAARPVGGSTLPPPSSPPTNGPGQPGAPTGPTPEGSEPEPVGAGSR